MRDANFLIESSRFYYFAIHRLSQDGCAINHIIVNLVKHYATSHLDQARVQTHLRMCLPRALESTLTIRSKSAGLLQASPLSSFCKQLKAWLHMPPSVGTLRLAGHILAPFAGHVPPLTKLVAANCATPKDQHNPDQGHH